MTTTIQPALRGLIAPAAVRDRLSETDAITLVERWLVSLNERSIELALDCLVEHGLVLRLPDATMHHHREVRRNWRRFSRGRGQAPYRLVKAEVRLTSRKHAELTLQIASGTQLHLREHWSIVDTPAGSRIRTIARDHLRSTS